MTRSRLAMVLIASIIWVGIVSAKVIHFADRVRDPGVKSWMRYQVIGPINSPRMPLYLTVRTFKPWLGEQQVVLSPARYDVVSSYTQAWIARSDCPGDKALANDWYTVQITEYGKEHAQQCMLPQRSGCDYLSGIVQLHGINWTATELRLITGFMAQARCQIVIKAT